MPIYAQVRGAALVGAMYLRADSYVPLGARDALYEVGKAVFAASQAQVPVLTGELKSTGELEGPSLRVGPGGKPEWIVAITYGDWSTRSYARIQHWRTKLHHPEGGRSRFLIRPGNAARRIVGAQVLEKVKGRVDSL